jgi:hypothetical protein
MGCAAVAALWTCWGLLGTISTRNSQQQMQHTPQQGLEGVAVQGVPPLGGVLLVACSVRTAEQSQTVVVVGVARC